MVNIRKLLLIITIVMLITSNVYAYPIKSTTSYIDGTLENQANQIEIQMAASIIKQINPNADPYFIYLFVIEYMDYDFEKRDNKDYYTYSAVTALNERKGTCVDFSLLYCSLCRALGYECNLVVTHNAAHMRNEVYDGKQWVQVDASREYYTVTDTYEISVTYKIN